MKKLLFFILPYILLNIGIILLLDYEKDTALENHLQQQTDIYYKDYQTLYLEYKKLSEVIFNTKINTQEILSIFKNASKDKEHSRKELYKSLYDTYELLKIYNIKQLHFHLKNNESFLRFHRPNKYGDDLTKVRDTISYVNRYKTPIDGFEEGRIYDGYRFVFPLFDQKNHLGSVEISFSTLAMTQEFIKRHKLIALFMMKKQVVEEKVFGDEKSNYVQSILNDFYIEKDILNSIKDKKYTFEISTQTQKYIHQMKEDPQNFSFYDKQRRKIITFINVQNPVSNKNVGVFIVITDTDFAIQKINRYYLYIFILSLLLLIIFYFRYKETIYQEDIQQNNKTLSAILQEADSGIALMSLDGKFLKVNQVYCDLLEYSEEELKKLSCLELSIKEDQDFSKKILLEAKEKGSISKIRKKCITKSNHLVYFEFSITLLPSKDAFIAVINSLEDKIQLEELNNNLQNKVNEAIESLRLKDALLAQNSKMAAMGEMIDSIAHQWINPIGVIKLRIETMKLYYEEGQLKNEDIEETVESSLFQIEHLMSTMREFRSFFKPSKKAEKISVVSLIHSSLFLMQDELKKNNIDLSVQGDESVSIYVNPSEFKHVLINIINNAKDAFVQNNIRKRVLNFQVTQNKQHALLVICDNAGGIDENIIKKVFEPYFTTKDDEKGTGIGLYMTKRILEKYNAFIHVENQAAGVCFIIQIPN